jgi:methylenetetrahydrofolate dehydrogenase (NADP+)/methenyltetrahydrofolate cyclohydrolase
MTAQIIDGKAIAAEFRREVREQSDRMAAQGKRRPGLAVVLVGDDPASAIYVRNKTRACEEVGLQHETHAMPVTSSTEEVLARVEALNARPDVHGILVQTPLPKPVDTQRVLDCVSPAKDVDGFHPSNVGLLVQKRPWLVPCTPAGIMEMLRREGIPVRGRRAVVVGRSDIVGKPMALLLMHADATVTVCHSRTADLAGACREADILVAAIGRAGLVRAEHVKPGAVVIDVGMNRVEDPALAGDLVEPSRLAALERNGYVLVGDVHAPSVAPVAAALTPVPGGVGPLTIAMLMANTVRAARGA